MIDDEHEDEEEDDDDENFSHKHRTVDENNRSINLSKPIIAALVVGNLTIASRLGEICTTGWLAGWLAGLIDMMEYQTPPSARATLTEKKNDFVVGLLTHISCFGPMIVVVQNWRKGNHHPSKQGRRYAITFGKKKRIASADDDMLESHRLSRKKNPQWLLGTLEKISFDGRFCVCVCICITQEG